MSLRERTMSSSIVKPGSVYAYEGKWYYVSPARTVVGPFGSQREAEMSRNCSGLLDAEALARVDSLKLAPD